MEKRKVRVPGTVSRFLRKGFRARIALYTGTIVDITHPQFKETIQVGQAIRLIGNNDIKPGTLAWVDSIAFPFVAYRTDNVIRAKPEGSKLILNLRFEDIILKNNQLK